MGQHFYWITWQGWNTNQKYSISLISLHHQSRYIVWSVEIPAMSANYPLSGSLGGSYGTSHGPMTITTSLTTIYQHRPAYWAPWNALHHWASLHYTKTIYTHKYIMHVIIMLQLVYTTSTTTSTPLQKTVQVRTYSASDCLVLNKVLLWTHCR